MIPVSRRFTPTSVPIAHTELDGQRSQISAPRISATMPLNSIQPDACSLLRRKYVMISHTPAARITAASTSVSVLSASSGCVNM